MVFSSLVFLFVFLPIILLGYYAIKDEYRNYFLLLASLFFYAWGEPFYVLVMLVSIIFNYIFGIIVYGTKRSNQKKLYLILSIIFNLSFLGAFKYLGFFVENINRLLNTKIVVPELALPLGISFFTFQAITYVVDIYRGDVKVQKNFFNVALYISLFPQLVAGPIVRYQSISEQLIKRNHSMEGFAEGVNRFIIGLSKKIFISNSLGKVADEVFLLQSGEMSVLTSWIGILAYTFQIFFDFSGYSDMAIGLGKMFGFKFPENFNYPYISQSITEFWRRWHMTLGNFFRDYVYIPLGGNRVSKVRLYFNLFIVWMLTGFWHGASWTFIAWGIYFGVLICIEKAFLLKVLSNIPRIFRHIYLILLVIISWVFFRADSFSYSIEYLKTMFGINGVKLYDNSAYVYMNDYGYIFILAIIFSMPIIKWIKEKIEQRNVKLLENNFMYLTQGLVYFVLLILIISQLINSTYNPFLYFRF